MSVLIVDGREIEFEPPATIIEACNKAGVYLPHLCWRPDFSPHGSCRVCTVRANGREVAACITAAEDGMRVENTADDIVEKRKTLLSMLFVEGNHVCPACEKSGNCQLQAVAYYHGVTAPTLTYFYPPRPLDASHPDVVIDLNRCILCELCVRASRQSDGKNVFSIGGRGIDAHLVVNSETGRLGDSELDIDDRAAHICPVGAILPRRGAFQTPIGRRKYDIDPIDVAGDASEGET